MKLKKIITLANDTVRHRFLAMERSLRAVGCNLPILVIPYNDSRFSLPANCEWLEDRELFDWLDGEGAHPTMRKYLCLIEDNYQFVDADIVFLRDPEACLASEQGFVTSCGHWRDPRHAVNECVISYLRTRSTNWPRLTFNSGQFACDRPLYTARSLRETATSPECYSTCVSWRHNEQPGMNLLVNRAVMEITNLTLPPRGMESTWAGDYSGEFESFWADEKRKPYLIHWAGIDMRVPRAINALFYRYLTAIERQEWESRLASSSKSIAQRLRDAFRSPA